MIDDEAAATESGRWLTGSELLVTQAWPVHAALHLKKGYRWRPFHVDLPSGRVSRVMRQQAGNSMNLFVITVHMLHFLLYLNVARPTPM